MSTDIYEFIDLEIVAESLHDRWEKNALGRLHSSFRHTVYQILGERISIQERTFSLPLRCRSKEQNFAKEIEEFWDTFARQEM